MLWIVFLWLRGFLSFIGGRVMTNHHQSDEPRENPSAKIGKYCSAMDLESASGDAAGLMTPVRYVMPRGS